VNKDNIRNLVTGVSTELSDESKRRTEASVVDLARRLEKARTNRNTSNQLGGNSRNENKPNTSYGNGDTQMFTTISELVNGNNRDFAGFGTVLENLYAKNKKYFSIIKDYEIMPILIPQINRVLDFLVNECLSPDVQTETTFVMKYNGQEDRGGVQRDIDAIRKEMKLDQLLRDVYTNRYKLGREYYSLEDYNKTFEKMLQQLKKKRLNESTAGMTDYDYLESLTKNLRGVVDEVTVSPVISVINEEADTYVLADDVPSSGKPTKEQTTRQVIQEKSIDISLKGLNIVVEKSPVIQMLENAQAEILHEEYSKYSTKRFFDDEGIDSGFDHALNEATVMDTSKLEQIVEAMKRKKLQRCTAVRFDPAKLFKLKVGGKTIGYFYVTDINENNPNMVNFAQSLKDQLMKTRATNLQTATQSAEEIIAKELAERIIKAFDPNLGISRVEDIDLLHDFIRNNDIYRGNKKLTFYYEDEIYDMSRANDSILTNAVFFTKLYATLLLNNIMTKVLRGRGRQIHTVRIGVSPHVRRYIDNAMASLAMPEHNLGTLHGSFEQVMNPFNGASDIVIPTEEDNEQYIRTDYIPGQDVDMNDDFLRTLLNSIVTSFGLDSAVIDATNGNLQFARTLSMESLQISNAVKNEQQDLHDTWERFCLDILHIMGNDNTKSAVDQGQITIEFHEPKSLIIQNTIDDLNQVKGLADNLADLIPELNTDGSEATRAAFIWAVVKDNSNIDFNKFEKLLKDVNVNGVGDALKQEIQTIVQQMIANTSTVEYGDETELTPEEQELMSMKDEDL